MVKDEVDRRYWTTGQAAKMLGVTTAFVWAICTTNGIGNYINGRIKLTESDLTELKTKLAE